VEGGEERGVKSDVWVVRAGSLRPLGVHVGVVAVRFVGGGQGRQVGRGSAMRGEANGGDAQQQRVEDGKPVAVDELVEQGRRLGQKFRVDGLLAGFQGTRQEVEHPRHDVADEHDVGGQRLASAPVRRQDMKRTKTAAVWVGGGGRGGGTI